MFVFICDIAEILQTSLQHHIAIIPVNQNMFSNIVNKNKHCVNLNVVTIWKCKYASSSHHNLMIYSSLILWPSDFICFSKWYVQQFGDLKDKNNCITLTRVIIIKQYYHYKFNLELNI